MALTRTTLSAAAAAGDGNIIVTSATGIVANDLVKVDEELMAVLSTYVSGTTIPVRRGIEGTLQVAHPVTAGVVHAARDDAEWGNVPAATVVAYGLAGRRRRVLSYSAAGAITLPAAGEDMVAILNGTTILAMTVAAPTEDMDGSLLYIASNGAAAHTVEFTDGLSGAGASYDVLTVNATAPVVLGPFMAVNALWQAPVATPMAGTVTNITATLA